MSSSIQEDAVKMELLDYCKALFIYFGVDEDWTFSSALHELDKSDDYMKRVHMQFFSM